jgi:hypothetical protein
MRVASMRGRCRRARQPVVWRREEERLCSMCGSAAHTSKNCPSRIYLQEAPATPHHPSSTAGAASAAR